MTAETLTVPGDREAATAALAQRTNARIVEAEAWADARGIASPPEETVQRAKSLEHRLADVQSKQRRSQTIANAVAGGPKDAAPKTSAPEARELDDMEFLSLDSIDPSTGAILPPPTASDGEESDCFDVPDDIVEESMRLFESGDELGPVEVAVELPASVPYDDCAPALESTAGDIPGTTSDEEYLLAVWAELQATQEIETTKDDLESL